MLVKYFVYSNTLSEFVQEIKQLKRAYFVPNKDTEGVYVIEFEDGEEVYLPLTRLLGDDSLSDKIVRREIVTDLRNNVNYAHDYYTIVDNRVTVRNMADIREAQLRLNYLMSAGSNDFNEIRVKSPVISTKIFIDTIEGIEKDRYNNFLVVNGFNGKEIVQCNLDIRVKDNSVKELISNCDNIREHGKEIINGVEFGSLQ